MQLPCLYSFVCLILLSHSHGAVHGEREADGAFSPRDAHHHDKDGNHDASFDHAAILGSNKEAEEFDQLTPAEAKKRLAVLVEKMDRNGDGSVDRSELKQWILRSFHLLNLEESGERFGEHDGDDDGFVSWKEYMIEEFDMEGPEADPEEEERKMRADPDRIDELDMLEDDRLLFRAADKDGDGQLDRKEFVSFTHPEEDKEMHDTVIKSVWKSKDRNGDELIDFQEYVGDRGKDQSKEWLVSEKDRFDSELDKDGDGSLGKSEIIEWMIPSNEDIADDEVSHLFGATDDDNDGLLSQGEILEHHDIFVGSEATDYGEHLHNLHKFTDEL